MECLTRSFAVSLLLLLPASHVIAQTGQIKGTVTDKGSGAVLPGVAVTATPTDTGLTRSAVTNEAGVFTIADLPIGLSVLEATLPGVLCGLLVVPGDPGVDAGLTKLPDTGMTHPMQVVPPIVCR